MGGGGGKLDPKPEPPTRTCGPSWDPWPPHRTLGPIPGPVSSIWGPCPQTKALVPIPCPHLGTLNSPQPEDPCPHLVSPNLDPVSPSLVPILGPLTATQDPCPHTRTRDLNLGSLSPHQGSCPHPVTLDPHTGPLSLPLDPNVGTFPIPVTLVPKPRLLSPSWWHLSPKQDP